ncbi:MAG: ATP-binding protein [Candidatus Zhuqueibacterota bacterium]
MKRKIITIDEALCNGCGNCIVGCSEGALALVNGKAKLVRENYCDGFGDCVGACPTGALVIVEREAEDFNETAVKEHLLETQGIEAVWRMEEAQEKHHAHHAAEEIHLGCPGSRAREMAKSAPSTPATAMTGAPVMPSELTHWPVQIHLVQPGATFFRNKELVVMSTCGPLASADVHWRYLRGRSVVVGCPKLDDTRNYAAKLGQILADSTIPKVIIARMEVPCCGGLTMIVKQAVQLSGRGNLVMQEDVLGINGAILSSRLE